MWIGRLGVTAVAMIGLLLLNRPADATTLDYDIAGIASGTADGATFTNANFDISISGNVFQYTQDSVVVAVQKENIEISGIGDFNFIGQRYVFSDLYITLNQGVTTADLFWGGNLLLSGVLTGLSGLPTPTAFSPVSLALTVNNLQGDSAVTLTSVSDVTLSAVPLPGALPMFATALLVGGMAAVRRRKTSPAPAAPIIC